MKDVVVGSNPTGRATLIKPVPICLGTGFFAFLNSKKPLHQTELDYALEVLKVS